MSTTTVAEAILSKIQSSWSLGAPTSADIHFHVDWYDPKYPLVPQITVTGPIASPIRYFGPNVVAGVPNAGLHLLSFQLYMVDIWVVVPRGEDSDDQSDVAELMRIECVKILNQQRASFALPIGLVFPLDEGRPLHEVDRTPRLLRYSILVQANNKT